MRFSILMASLCLGIVVSLATVLDSSFVIRFLAALLFGVNDEQE